MVRKNFFKRAAAIGAAGLMAMSMLLPAANVFAADETDANIKRSSLNLNKYIEADPNAAIPAATFGYTATPLGIGEASSTADMPAITLGNASTDGTQFTTATGATIGGNGGAAVANTVASSKQVVIDAHYAAGATADTSDADGVAWPYAGVYRYYVAENQNAAGDWVYDTQGYEISFYVQNVDGALVTKYIQINKATKADGDVSDATVTKGDKTDTMDFINKYEPLVALEVNKTITGNAADMTKEFSFTLSNLTLPAEKSAATGATFVATTTDANTALKAANDTVVTPGTDFTFKLGHGDKLTIADLPVGTTYTVKETGETNYTATYQVTEGGAQLTAVVGTVAQDATSTGTVKSTIAAADTENLDAYTNDYTVQTPTGIVTQNLPAFIMALSAIGLLAAFVIIKKKKEEE